MAGEDTALHDVLRPASETRAEVHRDLGGVQA